MHKENIKTGLKIGYKNFIANLQYTYISKQYTDATNAISSNLSGVIGMIPEYSILDLAMNYKVNNLKIEMGVNNLLNTNYFTRRATGYPGPGIIPSQKRNYYITLQIQM